MRRVSWSPEARSDYDAIIEYSANVDPAYAELMEQRLLAAVTLLCDRPIGRRSRLPNASQKLVLKTPYLIVYRATDTTLTVLRVLNQSRHWPPRPDAN
ncbi:type II toxin-antitoxin system RelE/ParE family toxin [Aurantimonas marianensis]|uniref:type II toxin-antitoxin system RelE/ParE family toxin n=1 Tax=Aurantimonas marianensis TaxID=2920428 RepID=UPI003C2B9AF9